MTTQAPSGWYPNPNNAAEELYWDGAAWSGANRRAPSQGVEEGTILRRTPSAPAIGQAPPTSIVEAPPSNPATLVSAPPATGDQQWTQPVLGGTSRGNGLGLAATIIGAIALLAAVIPGLSVVAWVPALVAIGLAIGGLVAKRRKRGTAIAGLILGALAILVGIAVTVASIASLSSALNDDRESPGIAPEEVPAESPVSVSDWAAEEYGTFEPVTQTGSGDSLVPLPAGVAAGLVTATHDGSANFAVSVIDAGNQPTGDLLVNTIGSYSGHTAYGLHDFGNAGTNLQVTADGNWSITIAPLSTAAELPASGTGDGVFLYGGAPAALTLTHSGSSNFAVSQYTSELFDFPLLVNEIGAYSGTVPLNAGPSLMVIKADGAWTAASQ